MIIRIGKRAILLCMAIACLVHVQAQPAAIAIVDTGQACSIRGMSIPDNNVLWISGSNGHVARSTNAGRTWHWMVVAGYEKTDFRDIHAFDSTTAVILSIGNPAYVLKTKDGGLSWKLVFTKEAQGMFLDAMDFQNNGEGICIGDPLSLKDGGKAFFVMRTKDKGDTWIEEATDKLPPASEGEAVFSASGTNIALLNSKDFDYAFISGGLVSNLYLIARNGRHDLVYPLPIAKGKESEGAFSMATDHRNAFYCVGGDYKDPNKVTGNLAWTTNNGASWNTLRKASSRGYRSCIQIINGKRLVACGSNGVDMCKSPDKWQSISADGFNVCAVSPNKKLIFFGGANGKIGMLKL